MIDRILESSLRQRAFVLFGAAALLAAGLWSAFHLPIDAAPDITGVQVQVNIEVPALAAEESEKLVTQPIEREPAGLPGVEEIRSITKFGLSQVTLQFKNGTDIYRARQLMAERFQGVLEQLPPGSLPKLAPISTGLGEIFYYNVQYRADATNKPATELEQLIALIELQKYTIKPLLRTVPGIAEINESGGYEKQYVIQPKPDALTDVGMTFSELANLVAQNVENAGGGIISRGGQQLASDKIGDGLGGFVVEATAVMTRLLYLAWLRFGGTWNQTSSAPDVIYSVLTGICVGPGTVVFFLLFQKGGPLSAVPMALAGGAALMAIVGILFFKEIASPPRLLGIVLALAGLYLLRSGH